MLYTDTGLSHPNTVLVSTAVMGGAGGGEEGLWGGMALRAPRPHHSRERRSAIPRTLKGSRGRPAYDP